MGDLDPPDVLKVTGRSMVPSVMTLSPEKPKSGVEIGVGLIPDSFILSSAALKIISAELPLSIRILRTRLLATGAERTIASLWGWRTCTASWPVKNMDSNGAGGGASYVWLM